VIGFLIGAKLYYAVLVGDWSAILSRGGFVFWGGLAGGVAGGMLMARWRGMPIMRISDVAAPGIAAGYAVGRTGCWAVGDDYGRPFDGPWATTFPEGAPPSTVSNMTSMFGVEFPPGTPPSEVVAVHPTQIYEVLMGTVMFFIILRFRDYKHGDGWLFGMYCLLAGIERFIVEFFRAKDDRFFVAGITTAQLIAIGFALFGAVWMFIKRNPTKGAPRRAAARAA